MDNRFTGWMLFHLTRPPLRLFGVKMSSCYLTPQHHLNSATAKPNVFAIRISKWCPRQIFSHSQNEITSRQSRGVAANFHKVLSKFVKFFSFCQNLTKRVQFMFERGTKQAEQRFFLVIALVASADFYSTLKSNGSVSAALLPTSPALYVRRAHAYRAELKRWTKACQSTNFKLKVYPPARGVRRSCCTSRGSPTLRPWRSLRARPAQVRKNQDTQCAIYTEITCCG